jgi:hypothetical protein
VDQRSGPPVPGTLGEPFGTIVVELVGNTPLVAVLGSLSHVVVAWIRSRRSDLRIEITRADGTRVTVDGGTLRQEAVDNACRILEALLQPTVPDPPGAGTEGVPPAPA